MLAAASWWSSFWAPKYWLPRDVEWDELPPKFSHLIYPIYFAIPFVILRIFWESFVGVTWLWLRGHYGNTTLFENIWEHLSGGFARHTKAKRILECFSRFSFYFTAFTYGVVILFDKSWLWNVKECWIGYPFHSVPNSVWWYYMLETGFYYSLLVASIWDTKKSDFWQLVIHHIVTIALLSTSWMINFVRVGTLVLVSHDVADIFLEGGKFLRYDLNNSTVTYFCYALFFSSWIITRLVYYPFFVIRSALFEAANLIQPDYDVWNFSQIPYVPRFIIMLLVALLALHIFWTYLILRIFATAISGVTPKDVRSDSEDSDTDDNDRRKLITKKREKKRRNDNGQQDEDSEDERESSKSRRRIPRKE